MIRAVVKEAMKIRNIKQIELAEIIGITKSTMSLFLNGKTKLGQEKIEAMLEYLHIDLVIK
ncbi:MULTISPECIES: helix-turn-helix transcriptional regulator [unclassified Bacteroides]|jgi:transcriptional regulator with XRE-family HTH domain|uniref:helix-turn-helix domain-containing protein n=1 Tax=unclassified Bacteroides TaxID=2646097 RepID=UPI000E9DF088|nr:MULTISPECIES: helix-turn-helix transcriptional regulator [unclassified Bacteroides]RGN50021.1 XRE family transcriptional regulator [Bacteroides sp. OM05-12]RHR75169.1 XRE family transcriptional regulator [Bacteroides sp. AF16-49]DAU20729.1 MAG TPA: Helix-turn-helix XRE-family like protein [Caudoviricetes sp.]